MLGDVMSRAELEGLGLTDAELERELARLYPKEPARRIDSDATRGDAFKLVVAKWYTPTEHR